MKNISYRILYHTWLYFVVSKYQDDTRMGPWIRKLCLWLQSVHDMHYVFEVYTPGWFYFVSPLADFVTIFLCFPWLSSACNHHVDRINLFRKRNKQHYNKIKMLKITRQSDTVFTNQEGGKRHGFCVEVEVLHARNENMAAFRGEEPKLLYSNLRALFVSHDGSSTPLFEILAKTVLQNTHGFRFRIDEVSRRHNGNDFCIALRVAKLF